MIKQQQKLRVYYRITNLTFDKWPSLFGDTIMTTAMVDRLTNKANIIQILGDSYRVKQTMDWLKNKD